MILLLLNSKKLKYILNCCTCYILYLTSIPMGTITYLIEKIINKTVSISDIDNYKIKCNDADHINSLYIISYYSGDSVNNSIQLHLMKIVNLNTVNIGCILSLSDNDMLYIISNMTIDVSLQRELFDIAVDKKLISKIQILVKKYNYDTSYLCEIFKKIVSNDTMCHTDSIRIMKNILLAYDAKHKDIYFNSILHKYLPPTEPTSLKIKLDKAPLYITDKITTCEQIETFSAMEDSSVNSVAISSCPDVSNETNLSNIVTLPESILNSTSNDTDIVDVLSDGDNNSSINININTVVCNDNYQIKNKSSESESDSCSNSYTTPNNDKGSGIVNTIKSFFG
jgi:hypothetical protein